MLAGAAARGLTPYTDLPYWDMDPMIVGAPLVGIGPGGSLVFDSILLAAAGMALLGEWLAGRRILWRPCVLAAIGLVAVAWHGWIDEGGSLGDRRVGAAWGAAVACGVAALHLGREARFRRVMLATLAGLVVVLAVKGAQQVLIEHPRTVEEYRRNRAAFLEAQGWAPESTNARSYERRLEQSEASGWYGLANVYASLAAAGVAAGFGLLGGWVARRRAGGDAGTRAVGPVVLTTVGLGAAIAGVALAGAKGGYLSAMVGIACTATAAAVGLGVRPFGRVTRVEAAAGVAAVGAIALPIGLVVVRGMLGEGAGLLSLLYRWFYLGAGVRIALGRPADGVGPDGFQDAYLLAKSPLSVESVKSPHLVVLDWWACLGSFGLAWVALLVLCLWWAGRGAARAWADPGAASGDGELRVILRAIGLVAAAATIAGAALDHGVMTIDGALVRVVGLGAWVGVGAGVAALAASRGGACAALLGAAAALAAHAQIDVVASWPASVGVFWVVVGAAAGAAMDGQGLTPTAGKRRAGVLPGAVAIAMGASVAVLGAGPALRWEAGLRRAAERLAGLGALERELAATGAAAPGRERLEEIRREVSQRAGAALPPSREAIGRAVTGLVRREAPAAIDELLRADEAEPTDWRARREASRLALHLAAMARAAGETHQAEQWAERAVEWAMPRAGQAPAAVRLAWVSSVHLARAELLAGAREAELRRAAEWLEASAALDPWNLDAAYRLFTIWHDVGEDAAARRWARRSLELDGWARLDREVHGLRPAQREAAARAAGLP
jgi:hypothetical protein